jgi:hypothetical protein
MKKNFDSIQIDMFSDQFNGSCESQKQREIQRKEKREKRREKWLLNKKKKEMEELYHFDMKHPENVLFEEYRVYNKNE